MDPNGGGDTILGDPLLPLSQSSKQQQDPLAGVSDYLGRSVHRGSSGGWRSALFLYFARSYVYKHKPN
uniref:Uncharacterized protein n=1 Tax=Zea mays TaxID=4577 RepID=B6SZ73_MAIZE|nr:hypothetical protein [Zea mays]